MSAENNEEHNEKLVLSDSYDQMGLQKAKTAKHATPLKSQYLEIYQNFMKSSINIPSEIQMQKKLRQRQIFISKEKQSDGLQFQIEHQVNNFEYVIIHVKLSVFQLKLTVLNLKGKKPLLNHRYSNRGRYGYVYCYQFLSHTTVFKILPYQAQQLEHIIQTAIMQYTILKINSSLQCGPFLDNSLGFQLIVFDDSVMYSMQQCSLIDSADLYAVQRLKSSLQLMHNYHIIHFDIKTQNIMYSPYYDKLVFIDFGFSQIISQSLGEKTLIEFRGSPAYCSQQMTKLLGAKEQMFPVDVYYNNMVGLKKSISQLESDVSCYYSFQENGLFRLIDEQIQIQFAMNLFKFKVFRNNLEDILSLLRYQQCILLRKNGSVIMQIFSTNTFFLFKSVYEKMQLQIHKFVKSQTIQNYFRLNQTPYTIRNTNKEEQLISFKNRLSFTPENILPISCDKYKEFLSLQKVFEDQSLTEQSFHILIEFLRFDIKNNQLSEKILIANKFNLVHKEEPQLTIGCIKTAFLILFNQCLKPPYLLWKKQHIFVVLNQLMILDIDLEPYQQQMFSVLKSMASSLLDSLQFSIQLQKILYMNAFKHLSDHLCMKHEVPVKINLFIKTLLDQRDFPERKQTQSPLMRVILVFNKELIQTNRKMSQQGYRKIINSINEIKNKKLKDYLMQYFTLKYIEVIFLDRQHGSSLDTLHYLKYLGIIKQLQKDQERFHYSAFVISKTLIFVNNFKELEHFYTHIIKCINCVEISSKYKFQMSIFLYSQEVNQQKLRKYSLEILESPFSLFNGYNSTQLSQITKKIERCSEFAGTYPQIINKFWAFFLDYEHLALDEQKLNLLQLQNIMLKYSMIFFFLNLSHHLGQQLFRQRTSQLRQKMNENEGGDHQRYIFYLFQHQAYLSAYYSANKDHQKLISSYSTLYNISKFLNNYKSKFYFLKILLMSAISAKKYQLLKQLIFVFYDIAKTLTSLDRYFQEQEKIFIAITLYYLVQNKQQHQFYSFRLILSQFLTNFPTDQYITRLYQNLEKIMKNPQFLTLMSYDRLSKVINKNYCLNRYFIIYFLYSLRFCKKQERKYQMKTIFIKIAQNIDCLKLYAKQLIMRQSIGFMIDYCKDNKRKKNGLIRKWGYRFLPKEKLKIYYKKKFSRSNFEKLYELKIQKGIQK